MDKFCAHPDCKKVLTRREGESRARFDKRGHCDHVCSRTNPLLHKAQAVKFDERRLTVRKTCLYSECGKEFYRKMGESKTIFERRETCGTVCARARRRQRASLQRESEKRICGCCGEKYIRKQGETVGRFRVRKNCSEYCGNQNKSAPQKGSKKGGKPMLPPVTPLSRTIPEAPNPSTVTVWRPESWGRKHHPPS